MQEKECKICLVEHDEEIHSATLSVHEWLREKVTRFFPVDESTATVDAA
jgi:hypothetical protein